MASTQKNMFVWIDLEMTGLNVGRDVILEIATLVTDSDLTIIHEGPSLVVHQSDETLATMIPLVKDLHEKSGLTKAVRASTVTLRQAEEQTLAFIKQFCTAKTAPLCGNTVWQDALFLRKYMPRITDYLHYRVLDVTAFKIAVHSWYPSSQYREFKKKDDHRAMSDIYESVSELRHYRDHFFINPLDLV